MQRKKKNKYCAFLICLFCFLTVVLCLSLVNNDTAYAQSSVELIDTKDKLESALANAKDGDIIEIGNILYLSTDYWLTVTKSVTLKSGLNERATINGGLGIRGGTIESEKISVRLENIDFVGFNDLASIELVDGKYLQSQPNLTLKQCLVISGFVDIEIANCDFTGFTQTVGGAINAMYGKTGSSENCRLSIEINNCKFIGNAANQGSALYLYGYNKNIKLNMSNCEITDNVQQRAPVSLFGTVANIKRCSFDGNKMLNFNSSSGGGGIFAKESELNLVDCNIINNQSTNGGGLYLYYTRAFIDGCVIAGNTTREITIETIDWDYDTGDATYSYETLGGYGGGIYIDGNQLLSCYIVNSSIYGNTATHYGGAMFVNYRNDATIRVECSLSTVGMNLAESEEMIASNSESYRMDLYGCILISDEFASIPFSADERYNYYATAARLIEANIFSQQSMQSSAGHLVPDSTKLSTIPSPELIKWANGKYSNAYGNLHIGANGTEPTTITYIGAEYKQTIAYGDDYTLFAPSKTGFTFNGWKTAKKGGETFGEDKLLLGGEILLYPDWKPKAITIALPIVSFIIVLAGITFFVLFKRRKGSILQVEQSIVGAETDTTVPTVVSELIRENVTHIKNEYKLSAREAEVVELLLAGKSTKLIAEELFITFDTVRFHCKNIYRKLSVHSQTELISFCQNYTKK